jgi:hypothetical protein
MRANTPMAVDAKGNKVVDTVMILSGLFVRLFVFVQTHTHTHTHTHALRKSPPSSFFDLFESTHIFLSDSQLPRLSRTSMQSVTVCVPAYRLSRSLVF